MSLYINELSEDKVITSYNFARNSDTVFSEIVTKDQFSKLNSKNLIKILETEDQILYLNSQFKLSENNIIFTNTYLIKDLFIFLNNANDLNNIKLITSQTDHLVDRKLYNLKPSCVSEWYSINVDHNAKDLHPIPLGLSNYHPKNLNKNHFCKLEGDVNKENKIYLNFQKNTNFIERNKIIKNCENKDYMFIDEPNLKLDQYIKNLYKFKFILSPPGNGIDTHRTWEALYAGSIPITRKHVGSSCLEGLGAIVLDDFNQINFELINKEYDTNQNKEKLSLDYWMQIIKKNEINSSNYIQYELSIEQIDKIKENYYKALKNESRIKKLKTFQRKLINKLNF